MKTLFTFSMALFFICPLAWSECWKESDHLGKRKLFFKTILNKPKKEVFFWLVDPNKLKSWLGPFSNQQSSKDPKAPFGIGHVRRVQDPLLKLTLVDETIAQYNNLFESRLRVFMAFASDSNSLHITGPWTSFNSSRRII